MKAFCWVGIFGVLAFGIGLSGHAQVDTTLSVPPPSGKAWDPAWGFWADAPPDAWQQTHWGFVEKVRKGGVKVLFLGDSLTKGWLESGKETWKGAFASWKTLNIGIGGDTTRQTLWRLDHGALDGIQPRVVVLMIGVNNIFTQTGTDDEIAQGIEAILRKIHTQSPGTKVLLLGILPLGNDAQTARTKAINAKLAALSGANIRFLDVSGDFQDAGGLLKPALYHADKTHLSASGYAVLGAAIAPVLEEMLK